jgi:hypothetical protein
MRSSIMFFLKVLFFAILSSAMPWDGIVPAKTVYHGAADKLASIPTQAAIPHPELLKKRGANEICGYSADGKIQGRNMLLNSHSEILQIRAHIHSRVTWAPSVRQTDWEALDASSQV